VKTPQLQTIHPNFALCRSRGSKVARDRSGVLVSGGVSNRQPWAAGRIQASGLWCQPCHYCGGGVVAEPEDEAEDGFIDRIQAMIFQTSSSLLATLPMVGIGPTTLSEPLRL
jgi:hypothetical protein